MSNIKKRLAVVEGIVRETGMDNPLPVGERTVVLYAESDEDLERLKAEKIETLRKKYGPTVAESDLVWVNIQIVYDSPAEAGKD
jgi:hypothetical protein